MPHQPQKSSILIVDDIESNRLLLSKTLSKLKYQIHTAASGNEALQICHQNNITLCLLDVSMPEINGFDLADMLRGDARTKHIQIIFVTGIDRTQTNMQKSYDMGAFDYIEKPIDIALLRYKVESCLNITHQSHELSKRNLQLKAEIERRIKSEQKLAVFLAAFEECLDAVLITNSQLEITYVNKSFTLITGYDKKEVLGKNPKLLSSGKHDKSYYKVMWDDLSKHNRWSGEIWNKRKNGEIYPEWETITLLTNKDGSVNYIATFSDLSLHKDQEAKIKYLANHDKLTGLPKEPSFHQHLKESSSRLQRIHNTGALLNLDIDDFKKFNETLGHSFGDQVLINVAEILKSTIRKNATLSRFSGNEFVIWLDNIDIARNDVAQTAAKLSSRIHEAFSKPITIDGHEILIMISIGIAIFPDDGTSRSALSRKAGTALYKAKSKGKNTFQFFQPEMEQFAKRKLLIETELRKAIPNAEFELFYQPQINTNSGKIIGAETLLRWQHKQLGFISPADFIPIAESTRSINELGLWVIKNACQQIKKWEDAGLFKEVETISVNISSIQFENTSFIESLSKVISDAGINPNHLDIELTETALIDNFEMVSSRLKKIKEIGCRISIDDFGTGYSSLRYLSAFPLDVLKIDKCFIDDITSKTANRAVVNAIITMGQMLGAQIIAEGVEQQSQLEQLKTFCCDHYQGYLFSPAINFTDFEKLAFANSNT